MEPTNLPFDVSLKYLTELSYEDLESWCQTNKQARSLCEDRDFLRFYTLSRYGFSVNNTLFSGLKLVDDVLKRSEYEYEYEDDWDPWDNIEDPRWTIDWSFSDLMYDAVRTGEPDVVDHVIETVFNNFTEPHDYNNISMLSKAFDEARRQNDIDIMNILLKYYIPDELLKDENFEVINIHPEMATILLQFIDEEANPELSKRLREVMPYTFRYNSSGSLPFYKMMFDVATRYNPEQNRIMAETYRSKLEKAKKYVHPEIAAHFSFQ